MSKLYGQDLSEHYVKSRDLTAAGVDKYHLYQLSVQAPGSETRFLYLLYRKLRNKRPRHFREDFAGTSLLTATWINMSSSHTAESFDNDPEPLEWGRNNNLDPLGDLASRAVLHLADVREQSTRRPDIRCAQNFSYWALAKRKLLMEYFKSCRDDLAEGGLLYIDLHGGPRAIEESEEVSDTDYGFIYVWEQSAYWPVTGEADARIHFRFRDGTEMRNAFVYHWRVWTLPEVIDMLYEAGFHRVVCYWEAAGIEDGVDEECEGYRPTSRGSNDPAWVVYVVALK